jgi:hypothetical protein
VIFVWKRNNLLSLVFLSPFVCFTGCNQTEQKTEQKTIQYKYQLKLQLYNLGGAQAVAREDFYLLNKDAVQIWKEGGLLNDMKLGDVTVSGERLFRLKFLGDRLIFNVSNGP